LKRAYFLYKRVSESWSNTEEVVSLHVREGDAREGFAKEVRKGLLAVGCEDCEVGVADERKWWMVRERVKNRLGMRSGFVDPMLVIEVSREYDYDVEREWVVWVVAWGRVLR